MNPKILFNIFFILLSVPGQLFPQEKITAGIAPGILHHRIIDKTDTLVINILEIKTDSCGCVLNTVKAGGKLYALETTSGMSDSSLIIASVNADFFENDGSVINNMISGGRIVKAVSDAPYDKRGITYSQFGVDYSGDLFIDRFDFKGKIIISGSSYEIYGINAPFKQGKNILYNNYISFDQLPEDEKYYLLRNLSSSGDTLLFFQESFNGDKLPETNDFILLQGENFVISDTVKLIYAFDPPADSLFMLTGGWPEIIRNGSNIAYFSDSLEGTMPRFASMRHPRTAIGFSRDSSLIYLVTVDGRQSSSKGMTLVELADLLISLGVNNALNLDGGGSTTLVIKGKVVNSPSDFTGERKVASAIVIQKKDQ